MSGRAMTALITGAAGGIGRVLCAEFRGAGYRVVATDVVGVSDIVCDHFVEADLKAVCRDEAFPFYFAQEGSIAMEKVHAEVSVSSVKAASPLPKKVSLPGRAALTLLGAGTRRPSKNSSEEAVRLKKVC